MCHCLEYSDKISTDNRPLKIANKEKKLEKINLNCGSFVITLVVTVELLMSVNTLLSMSVITSTLKLFVVKSKDAVEININDKTMHIGTAPIENIELSVSVLCDKAYDVKRNATSIKLSG